MPTRAMSAEHKAALAEGRAQGRVVRAYLAALEADKPKRGRKRTPESIKNRLDRISGEIDKADPLKRLQLVQERMDLEAELSAGDKKVDLGALEREFVKVAAAYGERKSISYQAWRVLGVSPTTMKSAGISRSGS